LTLALVAGALLVGQLILASVLHATIRRHGRERDRLINQICHLADKPWSPAPATPKPQPEVEPEIPALLMSPEQYSDEDLY
jgi:hypothetical protein